MDNILNPSWDLQIIAMEQQQNNFQDHQFTMPSRTGRDDHLHKAFAPGLARVDPDDRADPDEDEDEDLGVVKEMMYKMAAMQPVEIDPATIRKPKRRNVRISEDPQSVAARHRRERISERIRILQRLVPGGTKMDTASMLDEAIRYVKFLKRQIRLLNNPSNNNNNNNNNNNSYSLLASSSSSSYSSSLGFDSYKLLLADEYHVHGGSAAAEGFFAVGRGNC